MDVVVLSMAEARRHPPLLAIGEVKIGQVMGPAHLERIVRIRDLVTAAGRNDTETTELLLVTGAGFTEDLRAAAAARGDTRLLTTADLYS